MIIAIADLTILKSDEDGKDQLYEEHLIKFTYMKY